MSSSASPLVILHVTAPARFGGLERVVEALSVGHRARGHTVHVAAVAGTPDDAAAFLGPLEAQGVRPHALVLPGRAYARERKAIAQLCRSIRPSVVHTHGYRADVLASGVAHRLGIRTVTTVHGFTHGGWRNRLYEALQVRAFRRFDAVVAVSRPLTELLERRGVPRAALHTVVNAWFPPRESHGRDSARRLLGIPQDAFCVGWIGRLTPEKGADVMLAATALLPPEVRVSFIGDGPERVPLEARTAELGLADRVRWHGMRPDAGSLFAAFDAFALSSHTEGTPIVLFEAVGASVPVVATRVGGVPDVVSPAEALLVPPNDPSALAIAVQQIRNDTSASRSRVAAASARLHRDYAVAPWLAAYEDVYRGHDVSP